MHGDKPCVFVHTNHKQIVGALVARHSMLRNSASTDRFDVRILSTEDHPFIKERDGQPYLREGGHVTWRYDNLQSFTPLRFMPPEAMGYQGRAVVVDPDVFAVGDVWELLSRDMQGKAIWCRPRTGGKGACGCLASSVMLLDCEQLSHWHCEEQFGELFSFERDYMDWICLRLEPRASIGLFEDEWNDFDHLTARTRMLHTTKRHTQPWKTGLPVDFTPARKKAVLSRPTTWLRPITRCLRGRAAAYRPHPDPNQERFFFGLLRECLEEGTITEDLLREEMRKNHVRHDALEVLARSEAGAA